MAAKQHSSSGGGGAAAGDLDPKFEWIENATNYVLRINLSGFKKDDFRVQVDGAGRLTVRSHRPASGPSFHKVFQLPSTASLDDITGRFDASVLTLTVPKRAAAGSAAPPTTIEEIRKPKAKEEAVAPKPPPRDPADGAKQLSSTKDDGAEKKGASATGVKPKEGTNKEDALKKALDEATRRAAQQKEEEDRHKQQEQEQKPSPAAREEEVKPKATEAAAAAPPEKPAPAVAKPSAPLKPDVASGVKPMQAVDRESLAERVRQRSEEERAKAAAAAAAAVAEQKKKTSACVAWKERVASELEELTEMKWAQGLVETARNNKEVVATAIAAFSLGFFVSQKLFSRK